MAAQDLLDSSWNPVTEFMEIQGGVNKLIKISMLIELTFQRGKAVRTLLYAESHSVCLRAVLCKDQEFSWSRKAVYRFQKGCGEEISPCNTHGFLYQNCLFFSVDRIVVECVSSAQICIKPSSNSEQLYVLDKSLCCMDFPPNLSSNLLHPIKYPGGGLQGPHHQLPLPSDFHWVCQQEMLQEVREREERDQSICSPRHLSTSHNLAEAVSSQQKLLVGLAVFQPEIVGLPDGLAPYPQVPLSFAHNLVNRPFIYPF